MPGGRPTTIDGRLSAIETDIAWIRGNLEEADLVVRVTALETSAAQFKALVAAVAALVTIIVTAAKASGVIH